MIMNAFPNVFELLRQSPKNFLICMMIIGGRPNLFIFSVNSIKYASQRRIKVVVYPLNHQWLESLPKPDTKSVI